MQNSFRNDNKLFLNRLVTTSGPVPRNFRCLVMNHLFRCTKIYCEKPLCCQFFIETYECTSYNDDDDTV